MFIESDPLVPRADTIRPIGSLAPSRGGRGHGIPRGSFVLYAKRVIQMASDYRTPASRHADEWAPTARSKARGVNFLDKILRSLLARR